MPTHDYTPSQALNLLINKLQEKNERIAQNIQSIIDSGQDIQEEQEPNGRVRRKRVYRRTVSFTPEEALQVALKALKSYFIEIPSFINSTAENFKDSGIIEIDQVIESNLRQGIASENSVISLTGIQEEKRIEFELQTATKISRNEQETLVLSTFEEGQIAQQKENFERMKFLFNFEDD